MATFELIAETSDYLSLHYRGKPAQGGMVNWQDNKLRSNQAYDRVLFYTDESGLQFKAMYKVVGQSNIGLLAAVRNEKYIPEWLLTSSLLTLASVIGFIYIQDKYYFLMSIFFGILSIFFVRLICMSLLGSRYNDMPIITGLTSLEANARWIAVSAQVMESPDYAREISALRTHCVRNNIGLLSVSTTGTHPIMIPLSSAPAEGRIPYLWRFVSKKHAQGGMIAFAAFFFLISGTLGLFGKQIFSFKQTNDPTYREINRSIEEIAVDLPSNDINIENSPEPAPKFVVNYDKGILIEFVNGVESNFESARFTSTSKFGIILKENLNEFEAKKLAKEISLIDIPTYLLKTSELEGESTYCVIYGEFLISAPIAEARLGEVTNHLIQSGFHNLPKTFVSPIFF
jgi:hypothetical protein